MCHLIDLPARRYDDLYEQIEDDIEYGDGEPTEDAPAIPTFIEHNLPMEDASADLIDCRLAQDLESVWPAREERWAEIREARGTTWLTRHMEKYFNQAVSQWDSHDSFLIHYDDHFLRRFLRHLPRKLDFDSWVGKALIKNVAHKHEIPIDSIRPSADGKKLTYEVGNYWPHKFSKVLPIIAADLDVIPTFLFDLALECSIWLPHEIQLIGTLQYAEDVDSYRQGHYFAMPELLRPYNRNWQDDHFIIYQMHARVVLGYDWFELPFLDTTSSYNLHY